MVNRLVGNHGFAREHANEVSLNWLALGLLLAAWNAADDLHPPPMQRPPSLRGYDCVTARAVVQFRAASRVPGHVT
jgi:hypothetical protein